MVLFEAQILWCSNQRMFKLIPPVGHLMGAPGFSLHSDTRLDCGFGTYMFTFYVFVKLRWSTTVVQGPSQTYPVWVLCNY